MVTRNVSRLGKAFNSASDDRDYAFFGAVALSSAVGGVAAADASARLLGMVLGVDPQSGSLTTTQRIANGSTKVAFGALLGMLAGRAGLDNYIGQSLAVAGIGAVAVGGADLLGVALDVNPLGSVFSNPASSSPSLPQGSSGGASQKLRSAASGNGAAASRGMGANNGPTPTAY